MTATRPVRRIDLTTPGDHLAYVEILTPGGIVRVNTNLVTARTEQPVVVVEIEPNTLFGAKTAPGGDWDTEVRQNLPGFRTDVTLTKKEA